MQQKYRTISHNLSYHYTHYAKRLFYTTAVLFLLSFIVYVFFTVSTISSSFAYDHINREIKDTESSIANLEADRIARMKSVDLAFAKERGFVEVSPTRYISKNSQTERFSLHKDR